MAGDSEYTHRLPFRRQSCARRELGIKIATAFFCLFVVSAAGAGPETPAEGGQWGPVIDWPHTPVSAANLPDGRILTWSGSERDTWPSTEQTYTAIWNPANNQFQEIFHSGHNMFCAHQVLLEDGRIFVNGGRNQQNSPWTSIFDPSTGQWTQIENMAGGGRWYPTSLLLPGGGVFTALGTATTMRYGELWTPETGWQVKNGVDFNAMVINDYFNSGSHDESSWWPLLHVAPNGKIFHSGPTPKMHYIDSDGNGSFQQVGSQFTDWYHKHGVTIMYDEGKLLTAGGWKTGTNLASTNRAFTIDLNGPSPQVQEIAPMAHARKFHNAVMLPNGEVAVFGGNTSGYKFNDSGAVFAVELWNPQTEQWRAGASMSIPRTYHSVALLLTDGRILSGGGGYGSAGAAYNHMDAQVYSPPYLFNADGSLAVRPAISSAPAVASVGQTISVQASAGLSAFSMIRLGSTTHAVNTDVRFVPVNFETVASGEYSLNLNSSANVLIPGNWMLFAMDQDGVPSIAHMLRVASSGPPWINSPGDQTSSQDAQVQLQLEAGDPDDDAITFSASGLPAGLAISSTTGLISGVLTSSGLYEVTVSANDFVHGETSVQFQWTVTATSQNATPEITPSGGIYNSAQLVSLSSATGDASIYYTLNGADPDVSSAAYTGSPILVDTNLTLKARAYKAGLDPSGIASADFIFQAVPAEGLIGYWSFDEGAGSVANDSSGNGHHGTMGSAAAWTGSGYIGSALSVDGVPDSQLKVSDHASLRFAASDSYTVAFWVRLGSYNSEHYQAMVSKNTQTPGLFGVFVDSGNRLRLSTGTHSHVPTNATIPLGSWHHVTVVQDVGHPSRKRRLYFDGVEVGSKSNAEAAGLAGDLHIGSANRVGAINAFDGDLDEVRIYSRALSDTEILTLINQTTEPVPPLANAGADQTIVDTDASGDEVITLDGSGSTDSDGSIVSYRWTEGAAVLAEVTSPFANVTLSQGTHSIELEVTDSDGQAASDSVLISIDPPPDNSAPVVGAGSDFSAVAFEPIQISGASVSDDGLPVPPGTVSVLWSEQGSMAAQWPLADQDSVNAHVEFTQTGTFTLRLSANDGALESFDEVTVTVTSQTATPEITPSGGIYNSAQLVSLSSATGDASIYYTLNGADPDVSSAAYTGSPILVDTNLTLKARAYKAGLDPSGIASADFIFQAVPAEGLIGYWSFDEGAGSVANDSSGNGHHGTMGSAAAWTGSGYIGSALSVDGVPDSQLKVSDHASLRFAASDSYTVAFWVRLGSYNSEHYQAMVSKNTQTPGLFGVFVDSGNRLRLSTGTHSHVPTNATIPLGSWHHVTVVQDVGHPSRKRRLYFDGVEVGSKSNAEAAGLAGDLHIGSANRVGAINAFDGDLDEVRIYSRALSDTEILTLINQTTEPVPPLANAGADQTIVDTDASGDEVITLDGSGSTDSDGSIVSYRWTEGAAVLAEVTSPFANVTLSQGTHSIELEVTDSAGLKSTDAMTVVIEAQILTSITMDPAAVSLSVGDAQQFIASAFDQQGSPMNASFAWATSGGGTVDQTGLFSATSSGGPFNVTASAGGSDAAASVNITVSVEPVVTSPAVSGSAVQFTVGSEADYLLYNWSFGDGSPETGFGSFRTIEHTFAEHGRHIVVLTIQDPNTGQEWTQTFLQLIHAPLTAGKPAASTGIMLTNSGEMVWNVNPDNDSVTVIDTAMRSVAAEIPVADKPVALAAAPDGTVWAVNKNSALISIIDPVALSVVDSIALPQGSQPHGLVFGSGYGFVVLEATGMVLKFDAATRVQTDSAYLGPGIRHVSVSGDGSELLVSFFVTPPLPNEATAAPVIEAGGQYYGARVESLDAATLGPQGSIVLRHSNRGVSEHTGPGIPNYLGPAVISPDGLSAWVPSKQDNILAGALRGGQGMTFDQTVRAVTSKIDLTAGGEVFVRRIDHDNAGVASNADFGPYGAYLFTALESNRQVAISDAYTGTEIMRFDVGRAPQSVVFSGFDETLYVHNFMDRSVSIFEISGLGQDIVPTVTPVSTVSTVSTEALAAEVLLGKQLFYDARDPRLAKDSYMSCASCHNDGGQDGRVWDLTGLGEGLRNTITLEGKGGMSHGFLHWSSNFDEIQDFEGQIRSLAGGAGLMSDAEFGAGTRSQPLGDSKSGVSDDLDALAAYLSNLNGVFDSPYRNPDGTLTPNGLAGLDVYAEKGCGECHTLPRFTDSGAAILHDVGTLKASSGLRLGGPLSGIDTPTLLGVWQTPPYLHDGSTLDLTEAIAAHSELEFSVQELEDVASYLMELDSWTARQVDEPIFDPAGGTIDGTVLVTITTSTLDSAIYYTLNGSEPEKSDILYTGVPIEISSDSSIRARAYKQGFLPSDIAVADFILETMPSAGLIGYWSFDEGAGSVANDSSGNGHHGTMGSAAAWTGSGYIGSALSVDRVPDSQLKVSDHASLRFAASDSFTVAFWVRVGSYNSAYYQAMVSKNTQTPGLFGVFVDSGNRLRLSTGSHSHVPTNATMPLGSWHHVTVVQDVGHPSRKRRLYFDGVEVGSKSNAEAAGLAGDLHIGSGNRVGAINAFDGDLDEVRIYSRALSDAEITLLSDEAQ